ncbi:MAG TPA: ABC transporter substrate-binding protein [Alphaproteobacteria bacterium]|nr:ABC transporter substrate-binding protein [Alphaproteobacteria bacterium]
MRFLKYALAASALVFAMPAKAETVKVGLLLTFSGPAASLGDLMKKSIDLYVKQHEKELPPGTKLELVVRDETGPNPEVTKRLAQELITRERVQFLAGFTYTPNAMAVAPLATEAKVPMIVMNAGTSAIVRQSPYIARTSFTMWQSGYPLGQWAAKQQGVKTGYTAVADYAPGHDIEASFKRGFTEAGGQMIGEVRMPVLAPDYTPFMQRIKDAKPNVLCVFVPAGKQATALMKAYQDLGMAQAGIKLVGPGDITPDEELPNMGDIPSGIITTIHHYSAAGNRPANKAFVDSWKAAYGADSSPGFMAVGAWDGMAAIFHAIKEQKGKIDPDKTMALLKGWKNPNSPRGPIMIDPNTRDIVQNEYLRRLDRVGGKLANVEIETIENVSDPWVKFNPPK